MSGNYTTTPNLGLFKPVFNADVGNWGNHTNSNWDTLDSTIHGLGAGPFLPLAGGTMTGPLTIGTTPYNATQITITPAPSAGDVIKLNKVQGTHDGDAPQIDSYTVVDYSGGTNAYFHERLATNITGNPGGNIWCHMNQTYIANSQVSTGSVVGYYGQQVRTSVPASSVGQAAWSAVFELRSQTGLSSATDGILQPVEIDLIANGADDFSPGFGRTALSIVLGQDNPSGAAVEASAGISFNMYSAGSSGHFKSQIYSNAPYSIAVLDARNAAYTTGSANAIWLGTNQYIGMDTGGSGGAAGVRLISNGSALSLTGWGITYTSVGPGHAIAFGWDGTHIQSYVDTASEGALATMASLPVASSTTPLMDGTAAAGSGTTWARADHVHPHDTSLLPLIGGTLSGQLTINANSWTPVVLTSAATDPCMISYQAAGTGDIWYAGVWVGTNSFWIRDNTTGIQALTLDGSGDCVLNGSLTATGGTLSGGLNFGSAVAPGGPTDVSRHIALYGTTTGINVTAGVLNFIAGAGSSFAFPIGGTSPGSISSAGLNMAIGQTTPAAGSFTNINATGAIVPSQTAYITGTNTNNNVNAGAVGEFMSSVITSGITLTSGTPANVTSLALTAGDWRVTGEAWVNVGTTAATAAYAGLNTTSATLPTQPAIGVARAGSTQNFTASSLEIIPLGPTRQSIASTTTIYLVASATFASGTTTASGKLTARRMR